MISILESHFRLQSEINKLNSNFNIGLTPYEMDILLNDATLIKLEEITRGDWQGYDEISPLIVFEEPVNVINRKTQNTLYPVYKYISFKVVMVKDGCEKISTNNKFQPLSVQLGNTQKSEFTWGLCNASIVDNKKLVFDVGDYSINTAYINYIKYPNYVSVGGYVDINGSTKTVVEWQFGDDLIQQIIQKAAVLAIEKFDSTFESKNAVESFHN